MRSKIPAQQVNKKEENIMTSKKLNIKKGDIPETDEEVEKVVAQMEKKAVARKNKKVVVLDVPDKVVSIVEKPAEKEVVLDGNLQPATGKTKKALLQAEKQAAKPNTVTKPKGVSRGGHAILTQEITLAVLKALGEPNADYQKIADTHNITVRRVKSIKAGRSGEKWSGIEYHPKARGSKHTAKDIESEVIDGVAYHVDSAVPVKKTARKAKA